MLELRHKYLVETLLSWRFLAVALCSSQEQKGNSVHLTENKFQP